MLRFIAVAWDCTTGEAGIAADDVCARVRNSARDWQVVLEQPGLRVFTTSGAFQHNRVHHLSNSFGVVLGTLFVRQSAPVNESAALVRGFSAEESEAIVEEGPRRLVRSYWGWYVAFVKSVSRTLTWILRGPMSDLPCIHAVYDGVSLLFSQPEDCVALGLITFNVDWRVIQIQVGFGQAALIGQSAIHELSVVERGEAIEIGPGSLRKKEYWNPSLLVQGCCIEDPELVRSSLKATVKSCVHSWSRGHASILHRLSGGLDSSLVLHCLTDAPAKPRVTCINYYWEGGNIDERAFARLAANHAKVDLVSRRLGLTRRLDALLRVRRTIAPVVDMLDWQEHERERELIHQCGATAVTMGSLGDALFEYDPTLSAATDFLRAHGFARELLTVALNLALHQRVSIWRVLSFSLREYCRPSGGRWSMHEELFRCGVFKKESVLVSDEALDDLHDNALRCAHPWLRNTEGVPFAKRWQIAGLFTEEFYAAHFREEDDPPIIPPYLSQPLVELCLRIPSYLNVRGGMDRAMIREAFSGELPAPILRRRAKGSPNTWLKQAIDRDAKFVREFLLDGILVRQRVVDADKLQRILPGTISRSASDAGSVMNLLYTEAWLRAWSSLGTSRSAGMRVGRAS